MALALSGNRLDLATHMIWLILAAAIFLTAIVIPEFRHPENMANLVRQSAVLGILAVGQTFVIAAGMIDLSVGMIAGLVVVLSCWMLGADPSATLIVAVVMFLVGSAIGLLNGALLNLLKLNPLILTFGMLSILQGVIFTITDRSIGKASPFLQQLANGNLYGIPYSGLLLAIVVFAFHVLFSRTRFGHHLLAIGGNAESARRSGIDVGRVRLGVFAISGFCAALAGLLLAGRIGTGYPLAGSGLELDAIVAVVIGGTALSGGRGSIFQSIGGVFVLAIVSNALNLMEVSAFVQMLAKGLIVVMAIIINQPRRDNP